MLYLYAIADSPVAGTGPGMRGAPTRALGDGPCAVVSDHPELRVEASEDELWAHEEVVEALMDDQTVLPVRFATTLPDDDAVLEFLRERRAALVDALERVRGAVELGVRALAPESGSAQVPALAGASVQEDTGPGTAYMLALLERSRATEELVQTIHEPLRAIAREARTRVDPKEPRQLNAAYLVDRDRVAGFRARVEGLETELQPTSIVCTGPWPPYSFSSVAPR